MILYDAKYTVYSQLLVLKIKAELGDQMMSYFPNIVPVPTAIWVLGTSAKMFDTCCRCRLCSCGKPKFLPAYRQVWWLQRKSPRHQKFPRKDTRTVAGCSAAAVSSLVLCKLGQTGKPFDIAPKQNVSR